jgi:hypothetical protein
MTSCGQPICRVFLKLVASQVATIIIRVIAREEEQERIEV